VKLNVGCGKRKLEGYVGLDIKDFGQEYLCDVREGLPVDKCEQIRANHFLEHLTQDEAIKFLNDCHDKCDELYIEVPHKRGNNAWVLTHKTFYTEETFRSLERDDITESYGIKRWKIKKLVVNDRNDIHCWMKPV